MYSETHRRSCLSDKDANYTIKWLWSNWVILIQVAACNIKKASLSLFGQCFDEQVENVSKQTRNFRLRFLGQCSQTTPDRFCCNGSGSVFWKRFIVPINWMGMIALVKIKASVECQSRCQIFVASAERLK